MSTPVVVVQGTPVHNPNTSAYAQPVPSAYATSNENYGYAGNQNSGATNTGTFSKGEKQESKCRDPFFAVLFYCCVIAIVVVATLYGPDALSTPDGDYEYNGYVIASAVIVVASFLASGGGMAFMMCFPETLIKISLIFVVILAGLWMVAGFLSGQVFLGLLGAIFFAISICYARAVWSRIPFATANLVTAITAIRKNLGVAVYAYIFTIIAGGWSIAWSLAFVGIFNNTYECDETNTCTDPSYGALFGLFVAYYFVHQVLQSSVHVTVAGTVGHWWFEPDEANHCCSQAVNYAFVRTVTTSFGSICFGSLIVAILEALRMLARVARENDDGNGILLCIAECILSCLASIVEYFNKWAFIYVGLYGYSYMEAGKNVFTLFKNRGWEAIIADDLVGNTLLLVSVVVGGMMGCIGLVLAVATDLFEEAAGNEKGISFLLGFIIGLVICSILMSTIGSGVNAVIVLFAESPAEFQRNHPQLSEKMRQVWSATYPGSI